MYYGLSGVGLKLYVSVQ